MPVSLDRTELMQGIFGQYSMLVEVVSLPYSLALGDLLFWFPIPKLSVSIQTK